MTWTFRIHFSDGLHVDEKCESMDDCRERAKIAMDVGYLLEGDDKTIEWPSQSIVKFEYLEEN